MRKLLFILPFFVLLGLCDCQTTRSSMKEQVTVRDSVNVRDSVRIKDSLVISRRVKDSLRLRDSIVLHLDSSGKVTRREEYHERDHYHGESDSVQIYKAMLHEALAEREHLLAESKKEKEVVVKEPSLMEKLDTFLDGLGMVAIIALAIYVAKKVWDNTRK